MNKSLVLIGARRVFGERIAHTTFTKNGKPNIISQGGDWEKTIWPKELSQQDVNFLSNQAFDNASKAGLPPGSRIFGSTVSFNGKTMAVEGSFDPVSGKVISCYPSYNASSFSTVVKGADW